MTEVLREWRRPRGRPRNTWRSTIEADVTPLNFDLHTAWRLAQDRTFWRTATLRSCHATVVKYAVGRKDGGFVLLETLNICHFLKKIV